MIRCYTKFSGLYRLHHVPWPSFHGERLRLVDGSCRYGTACGPHCITRLEELLDTATLHASKPMRPWFSSQCDILEHRRFGFIRAQSLLASASLAFMQLTHPSRMEQFSDPPYVESHSGTC